MSEDTVNGLELNICRVSFKGNKEVLYDYYNKWKVIKPGDEVIVTGKNGLGLGRVEQIVPFEKRNKLCSEVVVQPVLPSVVKSVKHECQYGAKYLEEKELEDLLS